MSVDNQSIAEKANEQKNDAPVADKPSGEAEKDIQASSTDADPGSPPDVVKSDHSGTIKSMYEKGDLNADVMAQALDMGWSPSDAMKAMKNVCSIYSGVGGAKNIAGYPNVKPSDNMPGKDDIMAAAFCINVGGLSQDETKKYLGVNAAVVDEASGSRFQEITHADLRERFPKRGEIDVVRKLDFWQNTVFSSRKDSPCLPTNVRTKTSKTSAARSTKPNASTTPSK